MSQRTFSTGSVRDSNDGKGWHAHISPFAIDLLAKHTQNGGKKYGPRNWERGQKLGSILECAIRHANNELMGLDNEDHAVAAFWNWMAYIHTREMIRLGKLPADLDDLPHYYKGITWQSDAGRNQSPTTSQSGEHASTQPPHAVRPACSNTPPLPTCWWRRMMARMASTLTRWAWATP